MAEQSGFGGNSVNNNQSGNNNKQGNSSMGNDMTSFLSIMGYTNITASLNSIPEMNDLLKNLQERVKSIANNTATPEQKRAMPEKVEMMTPDLSPQIPGLVMSTRLTDKVVMVQPILVYRAGVTDVTETIYIQGESMPRGVAKAATSFMNVELLNRIREKFARINNTEQKVLINSPFVISLDKYYNNGKSKEDVVEIASNNIFSEWSTGLANELWKLAAEHNHQMPDTLFKDGKPFGQHGTAIGRVDCCNTPEINGLPSAYNLSVKASTTNKSGGLNFTQNSQSIATTYMNCSLETMGMQQYRTLCMNRNGGMVAPLVPVISIGETIPGETLKSNNSIMAFVLGLYLAVGVNKPAFFSEAFRPKNIGNRGNISNFNSFLSTLLGPAYSPEQYVTEKNINNVVVVNEWLNRFVSQQAVYVIDLPHFTSNVSNIDFLIHLINDPAGSGYHAGFTAAIDKLTGGEFSKVVQNNVNKGAGRNRATEWVPGEAILVQTNTIKPVGYAQSLTNKSTWFNLGELDDMMLRSPDYYGTNEQSVTEFAALISGSVQMDFKLRQYNIYNKLTQLFGGNVQIEGWATRVVVSSALISTMVTAMINAKYNLNMTSASGAGAWDAMSYSNDYLTMAMGASISGVTNGNLGMNQMY